MIARIPDYPAAVYVSHPISAISAKMAKETIYLPSAVAMRLLANEPPVTRAAPDPSSPDR